VRGFVGPPIARETDVADAPGYLGSDAS
jgi:hypothetical protein